MGKVEIEGNESLDLVALTPIYTSRETRRVYLKWRCLSDYLFCTNRRTPRDLIGYRYILDSFLCGGILE